MTLDGWLDHISNQHQQGIDMGLTRMQTMVGRLNLTAPAAKVITVAGTNGKGSTCVAIEQLLICAGIQVGTTLSPHISRFNERIRLNGEEAADAVITDAFAAVEAARDTLPLTYFEFAALAALQCFASAQVDVVILEIGLGGRLDAFNVIDADVAVITSIGLDHQAYLGDTLAAIGAEKAGILRAEQSVILGADMPSSVFKRCAELALQPTCYGEHFDTVFSAGSWQLREALQGQPVSIDLPVTRLPAHNLALAYHAAQAVAPTSPQALQTVAAEVSLAGRLEAIELSGRTCHADVGHNPASAMFLKAELARRQITPRAIICAMLRDKAHQAVGDVMFSAVAEEPAADDCLCIFVNSEGERGFSAAALQAAMGRPGICAKDMPAAIATALSATRPGDDILVFGSFNATEQLKRITSKANARTRAL